MKIVGHSLVKNEERFLWYSIMSAASYLDEIILWDNGSTDGTVNVIKEIQKQIKLKDKIKFKKVETSFVHEKEIRQAMLNETKGDWVFMLDGDEIWWNSSIEKIIETINNSKSIESIVVPTINLVGDMYHKIEERAGKYHLAGKVGHFNLRAFSLKIPGISSYGDEWDWGWVDFNKKMIQDRDPNAVVFVDAPYLHATHLPRSGKEGDDQKAYRRNFKKKYDLGDNIPLDFFYPEVFFRKKPDIIPSPWSPRDKNFLLKAYIQTPFKKIKRRIT